MKRSEIIGKRGLLGRKRALILSALISVSLLSGGTAFASTYWDDGIVYETYKDGVIPSDAPYHLVTKKVYKEIIGDKKNDYEFRITNDNKFHLELFKPHQVSTQVFYNFTWSYSHNRKVDNEWSRTSNGPETVVPEDKGTTPPKTGTVGEGSTTTPTAPGSSSSVSTTTPGKESGEGSSQPGHEGSQTLPPGSKTPGGEDATANNNNDNFTARYNYYGAKVTRPEYKDKVHTLIRVTPPEEPKIKKVPPLKDPTLPEEIKPAEITPLRIPQLEPQAVAAPTIVDVKPRVLPKVNPIAPIHIKSRTVPDIKINEPSAVQPLTINSIIINSPKPLPQVNIPIFLTPKVPVVEPLQPLRKPVIDPIQVLTPTLNGQGGIPATQFLYSWIAKNNTAGPDTPGNYINLGIAANIFHNPPSEALKNTWYPNYDHISTMNNDLGTPNVVKYYNAINGTSTRTEMGPGVGTASGGRSIISQGNINSGTFVITRDFKDNAWTFNINVKGYHWDVSKFDSTIYNVHPDLSKEENRETRFVGGQHLKADGSTEMYSPYDVYDKQDYVIPHNSPTIMSGAEVADGDYKISITNGHGGDHAGNFFYTLKALPYSTWGKDVNISTDNAYQGEDGKRFTLVDFDLYDVQYPGSTDFNSRDDIIGFYTGSKHGYTLNELATNNFITNNQATDFKAMQRLVMPDYNDDDKEANYENGSIYADPNKPAYYETTENNKSVTVDNIQSDITRPNHDLVFNNEATITLNGKNDVYLMETIDTNRTWTTLYHKGSITAKGEGSTIYLVSPDAPGRIFNTIYNDIGNTWTLAGDKNIGLAVSSLYTNTSGNYMSNTSLGFINKGDFIIKGSDGIGVFYTDKIFTPARNTMLVLSPMKMSGSGNVGLLNQNYGVSNAQYTEKSIRATREWLVSGDGLYAQAEENAHSVSQTLTTTWEPALLNSLNSYYYYNNGSYRYMFTDPQNSSSLYYWNLNNSALKVALLALMQIPGAKDKYPQFVPAYNYFKHEETSDTIANVPYYKSVMNLVGQLTVSPAIEANRGYYYMADAHFVPIQGLKYKDLGKQKVSKSELQAVLSKSGILGAPIDNFDEYYVQYIQDVTNPNNKIALKYYLGSQDSKGTFLPPYRFGNATYTAYYPKSVAARLITAKETLSANELFGNKNIYRIEIGTGNDAATTIYGINQQAGGGVQDAQPWLYAAHTGYADKADFTLEPDVGAAPLIANVQIKIGEKATKSIGIINNRGTFATSQYWNNPSDIDKQSLSSLTAGMDDKNLNSYVDILGGSSNIALYNHQKNPVDWSHLIYKGAKYDPINGSFANNALLIRKFTTEKGYDFSLPIFGYIRTDDGTYHSYLYTHQQGDYITAGNDYTEKEDKYIKLINSTEEVPGYTDEATRYSTTLLKTLNFSGTLTLSGGQNNIAALSNHNSPIALLDSTISMSGGDHGIGLYAQNDPPAAGNTVVTENNDDNIGRGLIAAGNTNLSITGGTSAYGLLAEGQGSIVNYGIVAGDRLLPSNIVIGQASDGDDSATPVDGATAMNAIEGGQVNFIGTGAAYNSRGSRLLNAKDTGSRIRALGTFTIQKGDKENVATASDGAVVDVLSAADVVSSTTAGVKPEAKIIVGDENVDPTINSLNAVDIDSLASTEAIVTPLDSDALIPKHSIIFYAEGGSNNNENTRILIGNPINALQHDEGAEPQLAKGLSSLRVHLGDDSSVAFMAQNGAGIEVTMPELASQTTVGASSDPKKFNVAVKDGIAITAQQGGYVRLNNMHYNLMGKSTGFYADGLATSNGSNYRTNRLATERATNTGINSTYNIDVSHSNINFDSKGYVFNSVHQGHIKAENTRVDLYNGVAFGIDFEGSPDNAPAPIDFSNSQIFVHSNNAVIFSFKNSNLRQVKVGDLREKLQSKVFLKPWGSQIVPSENAKNFKYFATSNLDVEFDKRLDTTGAVIPFALTDANIEASENIAESATEQEKERFFQENATPFFYKRIQLQRSKYTVNAPVSVDINSAHANSYFHGNVVGLALNSDNDAKSVDESTITINQGASVSAHRTDAGKGAIGLYADYGHITIGDGGFVQAEVKGTQNERAAGVYAINGSVVDNEGKIISYGNRSVGVSVQAFREDDRGKAIVNELGEQAVGQGKINVTNTGSILVPGHGTVGIQAVYNGPADVMTQDSEMLNNLLHRDTVIENKGLIKIGSSFQDPADNKTVTSVGIYLDHVELKKAVDGLTGLGAQDEAKKGIVLNEKSIGIYAKNSLIDDIGSVDFLGGENVGLYYDGKGATVSQATLKVRTHNQGQTDPKSNIGVYYDLKSLNSALGITNKVDDSMADHFINHYSESNDLQLRVNSDVHENNVGLLAGSVDHSVGVGGGYSLNLVGPKAIGLLSLKGSNVNNRGTIVAQADNTIGILSHNSNTVDGDSEDAVLHTARAVDNNNGVIKVMGNQAYGIYATNSLVSHGGTIEFTAPTQLGRTFTGGRIGLLGKEQSQIFLREDTTVQPYRSTDDLYAYLNNSKLSLENATTFAPQNYSDTETWKTGDDKQIPLVFAFLQNNSSLAIAPTHSLTVKKDGVGVYAKADTADAQPSTTAPPNTIIQAGTVAVQDNGIGMYISGKNVLTNVEQADGVNRGPEPQYVIKDTAMGIYLHDAQLDMSHAGDMHFDLQKEGLAMFIDKDSNFEVGDPGGDAAQKMATFTVANTNTENDGNDKKYVVAFYYAGDPSKAAEANVVKKNPYLVKVQSKTGPVIVEYLSQHAQVHNAVVRSFGDMGSEAQNLAFTSRNSDDALKSKINEDNTMSHLVYGLVDDNTKYVNEQSGEIAIMGTQDVALYTKNGQTINAGSIKMYGIGDTPSVALLAQNDVFKPGTTEIDPTAESQVTNSGTVSVDGNAFGMNMMGKGKIVAVNTGTIEAFGDEAFPVRISSEAAKFSNGTSADAMGTIKSDSIGIFLDQTKAGQVNNDYGNIYMKKEGGIAVYGDNSTVDFTVTIKPQKVDANTTYNKGVIATYMQAHSEEGKEAAYDKEIFGGHITVAGEGNFGLFAKDNSLRFAYPQTSVRPSITATDGAIGLVTNKWGLMDDKLAGVVDQERAAAGDTAASIGEGDAGPKAPIIANVDINASNGATGLFISSDEAHPSTLKLENHFNISRDDVTGKAGVGVFLPKNSTLITKKGFAMAIDGGIGISGSGTIHMGETKDQAASVTFTKKGGTLFNTNNMTLIIGPYLSVDGVGNLIQGTNLNVELHNSAETANHSVEVAPGTAGVGIEYIPVQGENPPQDHSYWIKNYDNLNLNHFEAFGINAVVANDKATVDVFNGLKKGSDGNLTDSETGTITTTADGIDDGTTSEADKKTRGFNQIGIISTGANVYSKDIKVGADGIGIYLKDAKYDADDQAHPAVDGQPQSMGKVLDVVSRKIAVGDNGIGIFSDGAKLTDKMSVGTIEPLTANNQAGPYVSHGVTGLMLKDMQDVSTSFDNMTILLGGTKNSDGTYSNALRDSRGIYLSNVHAADGKFVELGGPIVPHTEGSPVPEPNNLITVGGNSIGIFSSGSKGITLRDTKILLTQSNSVGLYIIGSATNPDYSGPSEAPAGLDDASKTDYTWKNFDANKITKDSAASNLTVDVDSVKLTAANKVQSTLIYVKNNGLVQLKGSSPIELKDDLGIFVSSGKIESESPMDIRVHEGAAGAILRNASVSPNVTVSVLEKGRAGVEIFGHASDAPRVKDIMGTASMGYIINGYKPFDGQGELVLHTDKMHLKNTTSNPAGTYDNGIVGVYTMAKTTAEGTTNDKYYHLLDNEGPAVPTIAVTGFTIDDNISSVGVYNPGKYTIKNYGPIQVGSVAQASDIPSVGIYSNGGDIISTTHSLPGESTPAAVNATEAGTTPANGDGEAAIKVGANSIGLKVVGHNLSSTGPLIVGAGAYGVYATETDGAPVPANSLPHTVTNIGKITIAGDGAIGVYDNGLPLVAKAEKAGDSIDVDLDTTGTGKSFGLFAENAKSVDVNYNESYVNSLTNPTLNLLALPNTESNENTDSVANNDVNNAVNNDAAPKDGNLNVGPNSIGIYLKQDDLSKGINKVHIAFKEGNVGEKGIGVFMRNADDGSDATPGHNGYVHFDNLTLGRGAIGTFHNGGDIQYSGNINVGESILSDDNVNNNHYSIGIYGTGHGTKVRYDNGTINVTHPKSFGILVDDGADAFIGPNAHINATNGAMGVFAGENAGSVVNEGTITVSGQSDGDSTVAVALYGGTFTNKGKIVVDAGAQGIFVGPKATYVEPEEDNHMEVKNGGEALGSFISKDDGKPVAGIIISNNGTVKRNTGVPERNADGTIKHDEEGNIVYIYAPIVNAGTIQINNAGVALNGMVIDTTPTDVQKVRLSDFKKKVEESVAHTSTANFAEPVDPADNNSNTGIVTGMSKEVDNKINFFDDDKTKDYYKWPANNGDSDPLGLVGVVRVKSKLLADSIQGLGVITPGATQGNNYEKLILQDVFRTKEKGGLGRFHGTIESQSISWLAKAVYDPIDTSKISIIMAKVPYESLLSGSMQPNIAKALDYMYPRVPNDTAAGKVFDKLDTYTSVEAMARAIPELRGDMYANIQDRMQTVKAAFNHSYYDEHDTNYNFTDRTNDWSIIHTRGQHDDDSVGISGYKHETWGLLWQREHEMRLIEGRRETTSIGLAQTSFDFTSPVNAGSKEKVLSLVLGYTNGDRTKDVRDRRNEWRTEARLFINRHRANRQLFLVGDRYPVSPADSKDRLYVPSSTYQPSGVTLPKGVKPFNYTSDAPSTWTNNAEYWSYEFDLNQKFMWKRKPSRLTELTTYAGVNLGYGYTSSFVERDGALPLRGLANHYYIARPNLGVNYVAYKSLGNKHRGFLRLEGELGYNFTSLYARERQAYFVDDAERHFFSFMRPDYRKTYMAVGAQLGLEAPNHYGVDFKFNYNTQNRDRDYYLTFNYKW